MSLQNVKTIHPLKKTAPELHRFYVSVRDHQQWYAVMNECRAWFGQQWHCQGKVRRKLQHNRMVDPRTGLIIPTKVWFAVPDLRISSWIATKLGLEVSVDAP